MRKPEEEAEAEARTEKWRKGERKQQRKEVESRWIFLAEKNQQQLSTLPFPVPQLFKKNQSNPSFSSLYDLLCHLHQIFPIVQHPSSGQEVSYFSILLLFFPPKIVETIPHQHNITPVT